MTKAQTKLLIAFARFLIKTVPSRGASTESERLKLAIAETEAEMNGSVNVSVRVESGPAAFNPAEHRAQAEEQMRQDVGAAPGANLAPLTKGKRNGA